MGRVEIELDDKGEIVGDVPEGLVALFKRTESSAYGQGYGKGVEQAAKDAKKQIEDNVKAELLRRDAMAPMEREKFQRIEEANTTLKARIAESMRDADRTMKAGAEIAEAREPRKRAVLPEQRGAQVDQARVLLGERRVVEAEPSDYARREGFEHDVRPAREIEDHVARCEADHDDYNAILLKAVADRLAEAFAERLHQRVRKDFWGYAAGESLDNAALIDEKYRGIRPAPGYPACPEHSEKDTLFRLLDAPGNAGVRLTESFAMYPAASVSGYYFSHPQSQYFAVARIGRDQLEDYARRKGWDMGTTEKWLAPNHA